MSVRKTRGIDTAAQSARGALKIIPASDAYTVRGAFDGALATHPMLRVDETYRSNPLYDANVRTLKRTPDSAVLLKLRQVGLEP